VPQSRPHAAPALRSGQGPAAAAGRGDRRRRLRRLRAQPAHLEARGGRRTLRLGRRVQRGGQARLPDRRPRRSDRL
ncbi:hypothetical protein LTR94_037564, partial [Friedmanniomyces endolithicus]